MRIETYSILINILPPKYNIVSVALRSYRGSSLNDLTEILEEEKEEILLWNSNSQIENAYKSRKTRDKYPLSCNMSYHLTYVADTYVRR